MPHWLAGNFESEIQMTLFRNDLTMRELLAIAAAIAESGESELSPQEYSLVQDLPSAPHDLVTSYQNRIRSGEDPLGDSFCELLSPEQRRPLGATYTPQPIVEAMADWAVGMASPSRVIDAGCGSGRFLVAVARRFKSAQLVGVELDPAGALLARANLAASSFAGRSQIIVADFRSTPMPSIDGQTLFIGNPPYIRHHLIDNHWKNWFVNSARDHGVRASQLAGMHVHFFIATLNAAKPGDVGVLITAAEWLDVNYGKALRELLLGELGGCNIQVIEPVAMPFPDAAATAAITGFEIGRQAQAIGFRRVDSLPELGALETDHMVPAQTLRAARRWTPLTRGIPEASTDLIELGELFRVHRGQVTGANKIWIEGAHTKMLPERVMFRSITRAKELFSANGARLDDSLFLGESSTCLSTWASSMTKNGTQSMRFSHSQRTTAPMPVS